MNIIQNMFGISDSESSRIERSARNADVDINSKSTMSMIENVLNYSNCIGDVRSDDLLNEKEKVILSDYEGLTL